MIHRLSPGQPRFGILSDRYTVAYQQAREAADDPEPPRRTPFDYWQEGRKNYLLVECRLAPLTALCQNGSLEEARRQWKALKTEVAETSFWKRSRQQVQTTASRVFLKANRFIQKAFPGFTRRCQQWQYQQKHAEQAALNTRQEAKRILGLLLKNNQSIQDAVAHFFLKRAYPDATVPADRPSQAPFNLLAIDA